MDTKTEDAYLIFVSEEDKLFYVYGNHNGEIVVEERELLDVALYAMPRDRPKLKDREAYDSFTEYSWGYRMFHKDNAGYFFDLITTPGRRKRILKLHWDQHVRCHSEGTELDYWGHLCHLKAQREQERERRESEAQNGEAVAQNGGTKRKERDYVDEQGVNPKTLKEGLGNPYIIHSSPHYIIHLED